MRMHPALRETLSDWRPRLEAEVALRDADVASIPHMTADSRRQLLHFWRQVARGENAGIGIDARGRPMTDSLADFAAFSRGDRTTMVKYGAKV